MGKDPACQNFVCHALACEALPLAPVDLTSGPCVDCTTAVQTGMLAFTCVTLLGREIKNCTWLLIIIFLLV